jgi:GNAT superfamily N-acetyltransferase
MGGLWRLTRNRYGRRLYEGLAAAGLRAAVLVEFRRSTEGVDPPAVDGLRFERTPPGAATAYQAAGDRERADEAVRAVADGGPVGSLLLTYGPAEVDALERRFDPRGAYVWRVYVDREHRGRGIGTGLVRAGLRTARGAGEAAASALIARDNVPSKRAFGTLGFEPTRELWYLCLFGATWRRERPR